MILCGLCRPYTVAFAPARHRRASRVITCFGASFRKTAGHGKAQMSKARSIPSMVVRNTAVIDKTRRQVAREFRQLLAKGYPLRVDGQAKADPAELLRRGYVPKCEIELFGTRFFLCDLRISHELKLMPAYVLLPGQNGRGKRTVHARRIVGDLDHAERSRWQSASRLRRASDYRVAVQVGDCGACRASRATDWQTYRVTAARRSLLF